MNLLSAIYGTVTDARNSLYESGWLRPRALSRPVISVGNITAGGSGKTPFVIALGELLAARGVTFDVLLRGYKRQGDGLREVTEGSDPLQAGDEPVLLARRLHAPVIVAAQRYNAGVHAERHFGTQMHLLDDGFQHRQLHRDFEIVLLGKHDLKDSLLPVGRLREPLSSLRRTDVVAIDESLTPEEVCAALTPLHDGDRQPIIWQLRRSLSFDAPPPARPLAFCGIARPERFFAQLRAAGVEPACELHFADHYVYTEAGLKRLRRLATEHNADGFVTTEKDEVKLLWHPPMQGLCVARLKTELLEPKLALEFLLRTLNARCPGWRG